MYVNTQAAANPLSGYAYAALNLLPKKMARKTREEAEQTRHLLLDTAEQVFWDKGVAGTSLSDIATAAGLTRGAIYWHFSNKLDLFNALCDRIMPQLMTLDEALLDESTCPALRLWQHGHAMFALLRDDPRIRRICGIHHLGCEQVGEMAPLLLEQISWTQEKQAKLHQVLLSAQAQQLLRPGIDPRLAALGLHSLYGGLMHSWLLTPEDDTIHQQLAALLSPYFEGIFKQGCWLPPLPPATE